MINKNKKYDNGGYTLLFAVLVSSLVLSVGISILNIGKKEFLLSSSARDSTIAFYAADSGLECAKHYDSIGFFSNSSPDYNNIFCGNGISNFTTSYNQTDSYTPIYTFDLNINNSSCAIVAVYKATSYTVIESRGYNIGWDKINNACNLASPKRVERALNYTIY